VADGGGPGQSVGPGIWTFGGGGGAVRHSINHQMPMTNSAVITALTIFRDRVGGADDSLDMPGMVGSAERSENP
jgi:hypothetical protein